MNPRILILTALVLLTSAMGRAQGKLYLGYSDGKIASSSSGKYTAVGAVGSNVSVAIRIPQSVLAAHVGSKVVGVNYGMPTSQGVPELHGWVRTSLTGANLTTGSTTSTNYGWREISVEPYTITGEEPELWIGTTYSNDARAYVAVSFAGTTVTDGCHVYADGTWTNYASRGWGSLSLEAIIEGQGVVTRDLALTGVTTTQRSVRLEEPISVDGVVVNNASQAVTNPIVAYSINGKRIGTTTVNATIPFRASEKFSIAIPTTSITEPTTAHVTLEVLWPDGSDDERPADNLASFSTEIVGQRYPRAMVVEEHTGSWCGWCVRGIVGLAEMKERHPENFIGIAVHNQDQYAVSSYDAYIGAFMEGYPNSIVNRSGKAVDPSYANLATRYQLMPTESDAGISLQAAYGTDGQLHFKSQSEFCFSESDADYRVAFVIVENDLPLNQQNFYSGSGTPMGGFESMPSPVVIGANEVARGIYPSPEGAKGSLPAQIDRSTPYDYNLSVRPTFRNGKNIEVVALLLNGRTGEILNAAKTDQIQGLTWGDPIEPSGISRMDDSGRNCSNQYFDLQGRSYVRQAKSHGIMIKGGQKVLR